MFTNPKESYTKGTQLFITFASGYIAGVLCALVSHPADTMVSKMNAADMKGLSPGQIYGKIGFGGLWKGLSTRIIMVGTLTGMQWWIYGESVASAAVGIVEHKRLLLVFLEVMIRLFKLRPFTS